ncbi:MAG: M4 family metallopeptidase, partial [Planctomycetota bacterium]
MRSLGAPARHYFPVTKNVPNNALLTAQNFIAEHRTAFGINSRRIDFSHKKSKKKSGRSYERFQQTYSGIPVFGAEVLVQLTATGGIEFVLSDIMRNTRSLDSEKVSTAPTISAVDAEFLAIDFIAQEYPNALFQSSEAKLMIYQPSVIGNVGSTRLVWQTEVKESSSMPRIDEVILVDAHTGRVALHFTQINEALDRKVYDYPDTLIGTEADPPMGIQDANDCYDFLADTYDFYFNEHGRDSIDDAGMPLIATVNMPFANAYWYSGEMAFGEGFVADDITAHELTHGVTEYESGLFSVNESGAINESFSDMWGEWVDLTNTGGNDEPNLRWLIGEDLPDGAVRNMADPPQFGDPDSKCDPLWVEGESDREGVYSNSGVGNKLCYLLTDGDTFNGHTVEGMGIPVVADLMYEAQTNLLTSSSDYADLHVALTQAALTLGWSEPNRANLESACLATELSGCFPVPPVALSENPITRVATPLQITLTATDDELPNPPGFLTYIVTSLPSKGQLRDPLSGIIEPNSLPYILAGSGNQVTYTPDNRFSGTDTFQFKANDSEGGGCIVDFDDYSILSSYWLETDCGDCGGADLTGDSNVDANDLELLASSWLQAGYCEGDSNVAAISIVVTSLIFSEDFESGLGSFAIDEPNNLWHLTAGCRSTEAAHSSPASLFYGLDDACSYDAGSSEGVVTSPVISLAGITPPVSLGFNYWLETENYPGSDLAAVEISQDGGPFYEYLSNDAGTLQDPSSGWVPALLDISSMADSDIQIRFSFNTIDDLFNDFSGFYVDDIKVYGYGAENGTVRTEVDTPVEVSLVATDDGLPDPPGALTYIITSLPANGTLNDPNGGIIDSNSLPYPLVNGGNQVVYTPDHLFSGFDDFQFKANDGGDPPQDGDSNIATISIVVDDLKVILSEDFEGGLGEFTIGEPNGLWRRTPNCEATKENHSSPTALFYGLEGTCNYDPNVSSEGVVTSSVISLEHYKAPISLEFNYLLATENVFGVDLATVEISQNGGL